jgi:hypothetical protein
MEWILKGDINKTESSIRRPIPVRASKKDTEMAGNWHFEEILGKKKTQKSANFPLNKEHK